jgi:hypothetical protein
LHINHTATPQASYAAFFVDLHKRLTHTLGSKKLTTKKRHDDSFHRIRIQMRSKLPPGKAFHLPLALGLHYDLDEIGGRCNELCERARAHSDHRGFPLTIKSLVVEEFKNDMQLAFFLV